MTDTNPSERVPPIARGDWVASLPGEPFVIGRVGDVYRGGGEGWVFNLSIYSTDGERIGRVSDACGGPGGFEPAIPYEQYRRIERPNFPLSKKPDHRPTTLPDGGQGHTLAWSFHPSVTTRADRTTATTRKKVTAPVSDVLATISDYEPRLEAASRRMAAQTLRDLLRDLPESETRDRIRAEVATLEREAEEHQAEHDRMFDAKIAAWRSERRSSERLKRALNRFDRERASV